ncbi:MAG TPA: dolichyl-phosphate beta-glucosyltransferase [Acidimicrobiales bacterium]|nr:dolichyl-phosphate beta-glucosyltransferase [Acidimicrobiales bacterium]
MVIAAPTPAPEISLEAPDSLAAPLLDVVVPIYNEAHVLASSIHRLRAYLDKSFPFPAVITIVDNGSDDGSSTVGTELAATVPGVRLVRLAVKGRGHALRAAWSRSEAAVVAYMDVDLSTSLDALAPMVEPLVFGEADIAIGSRLALGSSVVRSRKRDVVSRAYNGLLKIVLRSRVSDAQCGFKAASADVARNILPAIHDNDWFFDTEMLILAQRSGLRIHEVPVEWVEDPDSRVKIIRTAWNDLMGIVRLLVRRVPIAVH